MPGKVVLASHNRAKLAELQRLVAAAGLPIEVVSLADFPESTPPAETGRTFAENALIKARAAAAWTGLTALADDSGIEVEVLRGMPGVRSARWAGAEQDDQRNLDLLLAQVDDVPAGARQARFVCVMAHVDPDGTEFTTEGIWPGTLATAPRGTNGFGYDPIFVPDGDDRTSAELSPEEKDAQSHRARAVAKMLAAMSSGTGEQTT
ncbi:RdgB/HAM1 family non-canonical purine NTP pyrophosphatase [Propionibacteriaceae bacterium G1746]